MFNELRKCKIWDDNKTYITDIDGQCVFSYCTEISTNTKMAYDDERDTVFTLDNNGMPDMIYLSLRSTEDYNKFDFGDREKPNYIPWPKGVKEPK